MSSEPRTVLLVPFPEVAEVVERWLERSETARPSHGIPPHVTLLFPCPAGVEAVREVLEPQARFPFQDA